MLSRVAVNLALVAGLLVGYGVIASEATGEQYCLGGQLAQTLPDHAQTLVCTQSTIHTPPRSAPPLVGVAPLNCLGSASLDCLGSASAVWRP